MLHPFGKVSLLSIVIILALFLLHGVDSSAVPVPASLRKMDHQPRDHDIDENSLPSRIKRAKLPTVNQTSSSTSSSSPTQAQLWMYRGALYDPQDGRTIATVQGLEVVRPVLNTSGLVIDDLLVQQKYPTSPLTNEKGMISRQENDGDDGDKEGVMLSSTTLWSQKIFCYTTTNPMAAATSNDPKKVFRGNAKTDNEEEEVLLTSVRIRPQSPRKVLPLDQVVAVYETATTYISTASTKNARSTTKESSSRNLPARRKSLPRQSVRPSFSSSSLSSSTTPSPPSPSPSSSTSTTNLVVHSEWPNGLTVWNTASTPKAAPANFATQVNEQQSTIPHGGDVDFTVYAKLRSRASPNAVLPPRELLYPPQPTPLLPKDGTKSSSSSSSFDRSSSAVVSPKRSTLVQFGASRMDENNKFGARETYAFRNVPARLVTSTPRRFSMEWWKRPWRWSRGNGRARTTKRSTPSPTMSYTRYGEGPPWFAPGRHCLLELQGHPIDSLSEATSVMQGLVAEGGPVVGFLWREQNRPEKISRGEVEGHVTEIPTLQEAWGRTHRQRSSSSSSVARQRRSSPPESGSQFRLQPQIDVSLDDSTSASRGKLLPSYGRAVKRGIIASWERVRAATMVLHAVGD